MHIRVYPWLILFLLSCAASAAERPNILWLSVEDISPHLGCYGDEHARTPNVDAFAKQGTLYENAFVCAPVCAPCRSSIITGVYPTSLGTHNMRSTVKLPPEIRPFTQYLRDAGYYCTNNSKQDYQFKTPKGTWDQSSGKAHWQNRTDKTKPFFAVFNYTGTHESGVRGDEPKYSRVISKLSPEELHDPASLELPPYYPDTPKVREDWARYYNCITAMDKWVAERLAELDDAGEAENTIVFFWSDHGVGLPRGKRWLYDSGIKVPLIVRMPEKLRKQTGNQPVAEAAGSVDSANQQLPSMVAGTRTDELVSLIDLTPTVLNLAGLAIPTYMQGRAFLGENLLPEREYIYAARDRMDERYDMIRCVRTKRYKYIRNFMPWRPYAQHIEYAERGATMKELRRLHAEGKLTEEQALFMASEKPVEELYDIVQDPHELKNLLLRNTTSYDGIRVSQSLIVSEEMNRIRDLGAIPESLLDHEASRPGTRFSIYRRLYGGQEYSLLLRAALHCSEPIENRWDGIGHLLAAGDSAAALTWANRLFAVHRDGLGDGVPLPEMQPMFGKISASEALLVHDGVWAAQARIELLDALENAQSPWDRLQAANVLDVLPDFDEHADELRPVVMRVQQNLKDEIKTGPAENRQGLGYVERCVVRLAERLESP